MDMGGLLRNSALRPELERRDEVAALIGDGADGEIPEDDPGVTLHPTLSRSEADQQARSGVDPREVAVQQEASLEAIPAVAHGARAIQPRGELQHLVAPDRD